MIGTMPRWTDGETKVLAFLAADGFSDQEIGKAIGRTRMGVRRKRYGLGLYKGPTATPKPVEPAIVEPQIPISAIQAAVATKFGVDLRDLLSERRAREVARPRQVAMYLSKRLTKRSLPTIGRQFRRDHTTIIWGIQQISELILTDPELRDAVEALEASFIPELPAGGDCSSVLTEAIDCSMEQIAA